MSEEVLDIPISAAREIADRYGYHQIVIIGRAIGDNGREHVTTYGIDQANREIAERIGDFLIRVIFRWPEAADANDCL